MTQRDDARALTPRVVVVCSALRLEVFIRRKDAERFIEEVRGDEPEMAAKLRIEEREFEGVWQHFAEITTHLARHVD